MEKGKIKPFTLECENSVIMLEVYCESTRKEFKNTIFKLEDIVSITLDDYYFEKSFEVSLINGTELHLMYDESDKECLSYNELKKLWFNDMTIKRKE